MSLDRYMLEVLNYNNVSLGSAENRFLNKIMGEPKSTYAVYSNLKEFGLPMAYKNVHTRIKRLEELDLIEKAPGRFPRNAIHYRLTTQGLLYQISRFVSIDDTICWSDFLHYYSEHIIFKTLVLPYFEKETIYRATVKLYFAIISYLGDCYDITIDAADHIRKAIEEHNKKAKEYYAKRLKEDLEWQPRVFAFELVTSLLKKDGGSVIVGQLAKDKKFVKLLREVQKDFEKGFIAVNNIHSRLSGGA